MTIEAQKNAYQQGFMAAMLLCNARPSPGVLDEAWETFKLIQGLKEEKPTPKKPKDIKRPHLDGYAFDEIKSMMRDPSYAWSWQCNIAMPIMDSIGGSHERANRAAAHVMEVIFGFDVKQCPEWKSLEKQWADAEKYVEDERRCKEFASYREKPASARDVPAWNVRYGKIQRQADEQAARNQDRRKIAEGMTENVAESYREAMKFDPEDYSVAAQKLADHIDESILENELIAIKNAARFRQELIAQSDKIYHTPLSQLLQDAVILLLERVK